MPNINVNLDKYRDVAAASLGADFSVGLALLVGRLSAAGGGLTALSLATSSGTHFRPPSKVP